MYPRQDIPAHGGHHNSYYYTPENTLQYAQEATTQWPNQQQTQQHKMYPYQTGTTQQANGSRLDPTLAFPVALRPSAFEHARFIDKMQPGFTRVKIEKYVETPYEELFPVADPRLWTREDVGKWLRWTSEAYSIENVKPDRFEMNGKALCLMTLDMFLYRVPEGGRVLYHDFQRRLRLAVGSQS